jgi:signal transduction histidine kinase
VTDSATSGELDLVRLRRLLDLGRSLVSELDLDTVLDRVITTAQELTGARYVALGVLDEQRTGLSQFLTRGVDPETHAAIGDLPQGRGILGVLIDEPRPLRLSDVGAHPRSYGFPAHHPPMTTFLGVPVLIRGEAWGNLYLTEKEGGQFDEVDEQSVVVLAEWAAIAIENARLLGGVQRQRDELARAVRGFEATAAIAQAIGAETDLDRVLELIAKRARALVEASSVVILLAQADELVTAAAAGTAQLERGTRVPATAALLGGGASSRRVSDLAELGVDPAELGVADARAALLAPLRYRARPLGVLAAFDRLGDTQQFDADDERAIRALAAGAATAVATARTVAEQRLRESLEAAEAERRRWARELHDETLQGLAGLKVMLGGARRTGQPEALDAAIEHVTREIENLRAIISDLRPASLDELGLAPALRTLATRTAELHGLEVAADIDADALAGLAAEAETTVYRVVQEALTNVVKHARATRVDVAVGRLDGAVRAEIVDDGVGFEADAPTGGFGLAGMRERVVLAGGRLTIERRSPGTAVLVELPAP